MSTHRACTCGGTYQSAAKRKLSLVGEGAQSCATCADATVGFSRRSVLMGALTATVLTVIPGIFLIGSAATTSLPAVQQKLSKTRWGLLIDTTKCVEECTACVEACREEHGWGDISSTGSSAHPATDPQWIRKLSLKDQVTGRTFSLPIMCQHCESPPCVDVCPTGASFQRIDGIVLVDRHICIGCRYCMMACPYSARSFVHENINNQKPHMPRGKGCVESCTLCVHRIDRNQQPACVERCASVGHRTIVFGDLNDQSSEIAQRLATYASMQIRSDLKTNPGVHYQGL